MKHFCALPAALALAFFAISCGEKSDEGEGAAGGSSSGGSGSATAGTLSLETGGSAGSVGSGASSGNPQMQDGGVIELTEDQVEDFTGAACAGWSAEPETQPAVLQLVVDTSLSMDEPPGGRRGGRGGNNDPTKWDITRDALQEVLGTLPEELAVGLFFYPNMSTEGSDEPRPVAECVNLDEGFAVEPLAAEHRENLIEVFDDTEPNGWTPTHGAYEHALETSLLPADFPGQKYLLLITDGVPTLTHDCEGSSNGGQADPVDTDPIVEAIADARRAGVRTFLIGSPGSEDGREWMSLAAIQGATARAGCQIDGPPYCHMDMTTAPDFGAALRAGLNQVTGEISCTYDVPEPPDGQTIDPNLVNLIVTTSTGDAQLVLPDNNGDCSEGWQLSGDQIVLCEGTCSRVQADGGSLQLLFGCETGGNVVPK
jgi:hypothetical protein